MSRLFLIVGLFNVNLALAHDIKLAVFDISESADGLIMTVSADREDLLLAISSDLNKTGSVAFSVSAYVKKNLTILVDGQPTTFAVKGIEYTKEIIHISGSLNLNPQNIKKVEISNTFLFEEVEGQENIVKLRMNDKIRSFRLSEKLKSTTAHFSNKSQS